MAKDSFYPVLNIDNGFLVNGYRVFDPDGSYTGRPNDQKEKPIQDADDL